MIKWAMSKQIGAFEKPGKQKRLWLVESGFCFLLIMLIFLAASLLQVDRLTNLDKEITIVRRDEDSVVISIPLGERKNIGDSDLKFSASGCIIEVYSGNEFLYECGRAEAKKSQFIGKRYISIPLKEDYTDITVKLLEHDKGAKLYLSNVELCPRAETTRYYLINGSSGFFPAIIFLAVVLFLPIVSLSIDIKSVVRNAGLYASGFLLCFSLVLLDAGGHYLIFTSDQAVWNIIHEFSLYLLPFFVLLFFRELEIARFQRAVIMAGAIKDITFAIAAAALGFSGILSFDVISVIFHYGLIADGLIGAYGVYWNIKNPRISVGQKAILFLLVGWVVALVLSFTVSKLFPDFAFALNFDYLGPVAVLVFCVFIFIYMELILGVEKEYMQMEKSLELSRIQNFTSQMQPHFLYNALSSIRQIVYEDPTYAADLITDFTRHLRGIIKAMSNDHLIPFSEELKNIKAYVSIEKVRFGEKLTVNYDIQADDFEIIPLSVQPLIENAIRHGIYRRGETGGVVTLRSVEEGDQWIIQVMDTGIGFDVQKVLEQVSDGEKDSTGLKNLIFRLKKLMGAKVQIESVINKGTTVTVRIPKSGEEKQ